MRHICLNQKSLIIQIASSISSQLIHQHKVLSLNHKASFLYIVYVTETVPKGIVLNV